MITSTVWVVLALGGQSWTVDDDGPAQFQSIQAAIDAPEVLAGDTLLVHPGGYGDFTLDKPLRIVAQAQHWFGVDTARVEHVTEFTLAGMSASELEIVDVSGRGRLDECSVGYLVPNPWFVWVWGGRTEFVDCSELVVTRSTFHGSDSCYPEFFGNASAVRVQRSTVALIDCELFGGDDDACNGHPTFNGTPGLEAVERSDVTLAGTEIVGGDGTMWFAGYPALFLDDSHARIRGSSFTWLAEGWGPVMLSAIEGSGTASATTSGVRLHPPTLPPWVSVSAEPEPWIRLTGSDVPGGEKQLEFYGLAGASASIGVSDIPLLVWTPLGPLWLDRDALSRTYDAFAVGQELATTHRLPLDGAGGAPGDALDLQGLAVQPSNSEVLLNPVQLVRRW